MAVKVGQQGVEPSQHQDWAYQEEPAHILPQQPLTFLNSQEEPELNVAPHQFTQQQTMGKKEQIISVNSKLEQQQTKGQQQAQLTRQQQQQLIGQLHQQLTGQQKQQLRGQLQQQLNVKQKQQLQHLAAKQQLLLEKQQQQLGGHQQQPIDVATASADNSTTAAAFLSDLRELTYP